MNKPKSFQLIFRNEKDYKTYLKFRAKCIEKRTNATQEIIRLIRKYVDGEIK